MKGNAFLQVVVTAIFVGVAVYAALKHWDGVAAVFAGLATFGVMATAWEWMQP